MLTISIGGRGLAGSSRSCGSVPHDRHVHVCIRPEARASRAADSGVPGCELSQGDAVRGSDVCTIVA